MVQVQLDLPESIFSSTRSTPEQFVQELRIAAAVKWYEVGEVLETSAAEIAGIDHSAFLDALSRFGVSPRVPTPSVEPQQPGLLNIMLESAQAIPNAELAQLPEDGAAEHDHYIHGTPKLNK